MPEITQAELFPLRFNGVRFDDPASGRGLFRAETFALNAPGKLVVIGENGAGKSLFLRLAHGLIQPQRGQISWQTSNKAAQKKQAMVFQRPVMLRRSVAANLRFAAKRAASLPTRQAQNVAANDALKRLGMSQLAGRAARRLSGGEQQKLAIGRAWLLKPHVLFMDEPTASLDPAATHDIELLIEEIHAGGTQIILTTHNLDQARRLADQVLFIHRGKIIELTPAAQFFDKPQTELAARFLAGELLWQS